MTEGEAAIRLKDIGYLRLDGETPERDSRGRHYRYYQRTVLSKCGRWTDYEGIRIYTNLFQDSHERQWMLDMNRMAVEKAEMDHELEQIMKVCP